MNEKKKSKASLIALAVLLLLLIGLVCLYLFSYRQAKEAALRGDFDKAGQFLLFPQATDLHDPHLAEYIAAGLSYQAGDFPAAKARWEAIGDDRYLNTGALLAEVREIENRELLAETLRLAADGDTAGLRMAAEAQNEGRISPAEYDEIREAAYEKAVSLYHAGRKEDCALLFGSLGDYARSADYLTLLKADSDAEPAAADTVNRLIRLVGFENAEDIVYRKYMPEYLRGKWKSGNGYSFELAILPDGSFSISSDLPGFNGDADVSRFEQGRFFEWIQDMDVNVLNFTIKSSDAVDVFSWQIYDTIPMTRETGDNMK